MMARGGEIGFAISASLTIAPPRPLVATPGAFVATPEALTDWAIEAEDGDRCVFARVVTLGHHPRLRDQVQVLAAQHVITTNIVRHAAGDSLFDYIAKRSCAAIPAAAPPAPISDDVLTPEARRVYDHVCRRADQGAPMDNNRKIASAVGLRDADAAAYQLRRLAELGFIIRKSVPVEPGRVITVVETGAQTGLIGR